jgi:hypothetical protein
MSSCRIISLPEEVSRIEATKLSATGDEGSLIKRLD